MDVKNAIFDLYSDTGFTITGIRPGEKMHETLISNDEIKYAWDLNDKYIVFSPFMDTKKIKENYSNIKEITDLAKYSSDMVQKIPHEELKNRISETEIRNKD
jgi:FlaA1/EpsC-like NDP-sugar epimerase